MCVVRLSYPVGGVGLIFSSGRKQCQEGCMFRDSLALSLGRFLCSVSDGEEMIVLSVLSALRRSVEGFKSPSVRLACIAFMGSICRVGIGFVVVRSISSHFVIPAAHSGVRCLDSLVWK